MIDKKIIEKNFSKCAECYDDYAEAQNICGLKLINKIEGNSFKNILEIGCGTGNCTVLLADKFPDSRVKAIDISGAMVRIAENKTGRRNVQFIVEDAESCTIRESFDMIYSNASMQWFGDIKKTLTFYKKHLRPRGAMYFSVFGPLTFRELKLSLKDAFRKEQKIAAANFLNKPELKNILKDAFSKVEIEEETFTCKYDSLIKLLRTIKYTGTRGVVFPKRVWTPAMLERIEARYIMRFGSVIATYQIFLCKGIR